MTGLLSLPDELLQPILRLALEQTDAISFRLDELRGSITVNDTHRSTLLVCKRLLPLAMQAKWKTISGVISVRMDSPKPSPLLRSGRFRWLLALLTHVSDFSVTIHIAPNFDASQIAGAVEVPTAVLRACTSLASLDLYWDRPPTDDIITLHQHLPLAKLSHLYIISTIPRQIAVSPFFARHPLLKEIKLRAIPTDFGRFMHTASVQSAHIRHGVDGVRLTYLSMSPGPSPAASTACKDLLAASQHLNRADINVSSLSSTEADDLLGALGPSLATLCIRADPLECMPTLALPQATGLRHLIIASGRSTSVEPLVRILPTLPVKLTSLGLVLGPLVRKSWSS
jgi:hypothetical protein